MKYFDAHTHTNFVAYDEDRDEVMKRSLDAGVGMNVVGTQIDTSRAALELARRYDNVWATSACIRRTPPNHTTIPRSSATAGKSSLRAASCSI